MCSLDTFHAKSPHTRSLKGLICEIYMLHSSQKTEYKWWTFCLPMDDLTGKTQQADLPYQLMFSVLGHMLTTINDQDPCYTGL